MNRLSKNLAYLIARREINPTILSKETGVPQPTIHRILKGESEDPRTGTLKPLADYFGCSVDALRNRDFENPREQLQKSSNELVSYDAPKLQRLDTQIRESKPRPKRPKGGNLPLFNALELFRKSLPSPLDDNLEQSEAIQGFRYRFHYLSHKVAADLGIVQVMSVPGSDKGRMVHAPTIAKSLWKLSSFKLMTEAANPEREYFLFLILEDETGGPLPLRTLSRYMTEGSLHGVKATLSGIEDAATWISNIEEGSVLHFSFEDEEGAEDS